jgi:hypothetical protein
MKTSSILDFVLFGSWEEVGETGISSLFYQWLHLRARKIRATCHFSHVVRFIFSFVTSFFRFQEAKVDSFVYLKRFAKCF